ncbi:MAG: hypothetical protein WC528_00720 [Patescibacteria group bacterium]
MNKKSIILLIIIIVLGILGFLATVRFQSTEINNNNGQEKENVN